ncbi:MAG: putative sugar O-methyltransferase [Promethearchaeota archaeon]
MKFKGIWTLGKIPSIRYKSILERAVSRPDEFLRFKNDPDYWQIVGIDGYDKNTAEDLAKIIKNEHPDLLGHIKKFQKNDEIGKPPCQETQIGKFSPNTLRYVVVLGNLIKHFGSLENKRIIEVGSGYGGQCFIISQKYNFKSYTLIDIPGAIKLSKKYLSKLLVENVIYQDTENIESDSSDLFISNFAFTELDEVGWNFYIDNVISKADNFYIATNIVTKHRSLDNDRYKCLYNKLRKIFEIELQKELSFIKQGTGIWIGRKK